VRVVHFRESPPRDDVGALRSEPCVLFSIQRYLADKRRLPLGPCSRLEPRALWGPRGWALYCERGTPVAM